MIILGEDEEKNCLVKSEGIFNEPVIISGMDCIEAIAMSDGRELFSF